MKLIIADYLAHVSERNSLDRIVPELLSMMGLNVMTSPSIGTRQFGVDVSAVGMLPGDKKEYVYLFTIKSGDVDRKTWDVGEQSLRTSINEITSEYVNTKIPAEHKGKPIKICICFGGKIKENIAPVVRNYLMGEQKRLRLQKIKFEEWNGDKVAGYILKYFMSERLLPVKGQNLLRKSLAMCAFPEISISCFNQFSSEVLGDSPKTQMVRLKRARLVLLGACVLATHAIECGNLESSLSAIEVNTLRLWEYLHIGKYVRNGRSIPSAAYSIITSLYQLYLDIGTMYADKILPYCAERFSFAIACNVNNEVDVNLATFKALGRLSSLGLCAIGLSDVLKVVAPQYSASMRSLATRVSNVVIGLIVNNPTSFLPIQDSFSVDISLAMYFMARMGNFKGIEWWLQGMCEQMSVAFWEGRAVPALHLEYGELLDHVGQMHDSDYINEILPSSELFPYCMYVSVAIKADKAWKVLESFVEKYLKGCDFQMWFPNENTEASFYGSKIIDGTQLCSLPHNNRKEFIRRIVNEFEQVNTKQMPSCMTGIFAGLFMIGCYVNRVCVPAFCWNKIDVQS